VSGASGWVGTGVPWQDVPRSSPSSVRLPPPLREHLAVAVAVDGWSVASVVVALLGRGAVEWPVVRSSTREVS